MNEFFNLFASAALRWFNASYSTVRNFESRFAGARESLLNRFQNVSARAVNDFANFADDARRAARNWNNSSRDDYSPSLDNIPDATRAQRRAGKRGPSVLEYQVRFKLCYYGADGTLLREEWVRDQEDFGLHATRKQVLGRFKQLWDYTPEMFHNERYRKQQGEFRVEVCGFNVDSIVRKIQGT
jgi:hypothetical protein